MGCSISLSTHVSLGRSYTILLWANYHSVKNTHFKASMLVQARRRLGANFWLPARVPTSLLPSTRREADIFATASSELALMVQCQLCIRLLTAKTWQDTTLGIFT